MAWERKKKLLQPSIPHLVLKVRSISVSGEWGGSGRQVTQIKLNLTKHALNGYYLLASTFNFNKPHSGWGPLVNWGHLWPISIMRLGNFFFLSSKLAASRNETTPKALLIFVPHKTQPPDGRKLPPLCARMQPVHFGRGWGRTRLGWLISFRIFIASCPTGV